MKTNIIAQYVKFSCKFLWQKVNGPGFALGK